jgi:hypothetical protein
MVGDRVTVMLNGKTVIENAQIPDIAEEGPIGLQHHGGINPKTGQMSPASSLVQFRNIWIRRLRRKEGESVANAVPSYDEQGFVPLFNVEDLRGWLTGADNAWIVKDGVLTVKRDMDGKEHNFDYLWTKDKYGDFILDLEFKVVEGTNSGIFFRTADLKDPVYTGIEVQVCNSYGRNKITKQGKTVFRYMTKKPKKTNLAANSVCCFHPLNTPAGERLTDLAPGDHHHHRGVFLAWHTMTFTEKADFSVFGPTGPTHGWNISRADFWGWGEFAPTQGRVIKNRKVDLVKTDGQEAVVEIHNDWTINSRVMMTEKTTAKVREQDGVYIIDLDYALTPQLDLTLDHTAFGGFCVRARNDGDACYATAEGKVNLSDPHYSVPELNWPAKK